jgi:hypothetical protein
VQRLIRSNDNFAGPRKKKMSIKRNIAATDKSDLKQIHEKIQKVNMHVYADIGNIILEYGITASA